MHPDDEALGTASSSSAPLMASTVETEFEAPVEVPAASLYVNIDVNDLLEQGYSQPAIFELVGKMKDLLGA